MDSSTELNELCIFNVKHNYVKSFACKWSHDNFISILTDCGVHILEFLPDVKRIDDLASFRRYFIEPSKETIAHRTDIPVNRSVRNWQRDQIYHLINDVVMTPLNSDNNRWCNVDFEKATICCIESLWSPSGVIKYSKCLLLTLSNIGVVEIVLLKKTLENEYLNLTNMWITYLRSKWTAVDINNEYEEHKKRVYRIQTVCMEWSPLYCENSFSFVILAHRDGTLSIWKYLTSSIVKLNDSVPLVCDYATDEYRISSLHWIKADENKGYLIFGSLRGTVNLLTFDHLKDDKIVCTDMIPLWTENDQIQITHITSQTFNDTFIVLVLKGMFIICFVISKSGTLICSNFSKTGNITITGCQQITPIKYVLSCFTGFLTLLELKFIKNNIELIQTPIKNNLKWDHMGSTGICCSRNGVLWIISGVYLKEIDHLVIREPMPIIMCLPTIDIESILLKNPTQQLTDYWDCIEALKLSLDQNNGLDLKCIVKLIKYDEVSLYQLKIFMWMSRAFEFFIQRKKTPSKIEDVTPSSKLEFLLRGKYGIELMKELLELHESGVKLNEKQLKSLQYLSFVLIAFKTSDCFKTYLSEVTGKNIDNLILQSKTIQTKELDKCLLCEEKISAMLCPNGHEGERCCVTFLQISEISYCVCRLCESPVDPNIDKRPVFCPFCDNIVDFDVLIQ